MNSWCWIWGHKIYGLPDFDNDRPCQRSGCTFNQKKLTWGSLPEAPTIKKIEPISKPENKPDHAKQPTPACIFLDNLKHPQYKYARHTISNDFLLEIEKKIREDQKEKCAAHLIDHVDSYSRLEFAEETDIRKIIMEAPE